MLTPNLGISIYFLTVFSPLLSFSQSPSQINSRITRLCSEMSNTCARSCQSYVRLCNFMTIISPPQVADVPLTTLPTTLVTGTPGSLNTQTPVINSSIIAMRCDSLRDNFREGLCTEMSGTCARNCQTFIEQCNLASSPPLSQSSISPNIGVQIKPPSSADAPQGQEPSPTSTAIISGNGTPSPGHAPSSPTGTGQSPEQHGCKKYKASCVDHRDCCNFLYCKRFKHETGVEAKLGSCEHDPAVLLKKA